jgi:hypothetical protein
MPRLSIVLALPAALGVAACATPHHSLERLQPTALETALGRARSDLNCPSATGAVASRELVRSGASGADAGGTRIAEYTIEVAGCGERATLLVGCPERGTGCFTARVQKAGEAPPTDVRSIGLFDTIDIAEEAYVYGFPMIAGYKAMHEFAIDKASSQYKAPFNQIHNTAETATPKDTAIVTPNADTPYSIVWMDLRAEPVVLCMPAIDKRRYYSVQLIDLYAFNVGYIGSRATGNGAGCYLVSGPGWKGQRPAGTAKAFAVETQYALAIYRTQLFSPADLDNVRKVQAGYRVQTLSAFLKQTAPAAPPTPQFPKFTDKAFKTEAFTYLNFLLQFTPAPPEEKALRARFAEIGIAPGKPYDYARLGLEDKLGTGVGIKQGFERIKLKREHLGREVNGWRVSAPFGDRAFYHGDWLLRAGAALAGLYGNDEIEAMYPVAYVDHRGAKLDAGRYRYTITFPARAYPPVNAFWSVTMYDATSQLLVANPINRHLINSAMLPQLRKNADGSLTIHVQKDPPAKERAANWLPAPDGPFYLVMRLYWPKKEALDGIWKPAPVVRTG